VLSDEVRNADELTVYLLEIFRGADVNNQGCLYKVDLVDVLQRGDFGLTKIQVLAVMSGADQDENGFVNYEKLAPVAAQMIRSIWDQNADLDKALYLEGQATEEDTIFGKDRQEVYDTIMAGFLEFDKDGNGTLDKEEFKECLSQTELLGRDLSRAEFNSVMAAVDHDADGKISYEEFLNMVLDVMQYFWEEENYAMSQENAD
jgi:Ca2+-binding EF-hand superfamily protein